MIRVLVVHNEYQHSGGEDSVVASEVELLRKFGHSVQIYSENNCSVDKLNRLALLGRSVWARKSMVKLDNMISEFSPNIIHVHNTLPLISPAIFWLSQKRNIPVIQTLHNYRLGCLSAIFLRDGVICEQCIKHSYWRGVKERCYRGSYAASAALAFIQTCHWIIGTFERKVDRYIALSDFGRKKFIEMGIPEEIISIKPNFVDSGDYSKKNRGSVGLYVGRLSQEKGVEDLLKSLTVNPQLRIKVAGSGPLMDLVTSHPQVDYCGWLSPEEVLAAMADAAFLVIPSRCYEGFPRALVEAYSVGIPVIASNIGALAENVQDGVSGMLFPAGDTRALAVKMDFLSRSQIESERMGTNARKIYEESFTADSNYFHLLSIYNEVLVKRNRGQGES